ncbi:MAG: Uncharacterised protein [Hyphomonas sp. TMED17]|nr:MAG: Uncharacterised protein [Hyphomonas sp. TMED17]
MANWARDVYRDAPNGFVIRKTMVYTDLQSPPPRRINMLELHWRHGLKAN